MPVIRHKGTLYRVTAEEVLPPSGNRSTGVVKYVGVWQQLNTQNGSPLNSTGTEVGHEDEAIADALGNLQQA